MRNVLRILAFMVAATAAAPAVRADEALDAVLAADRAFATLASDSGTQAAFLQYLAADGVLFRPTAVNGREWLRTHEEASGRLEWAPAAGAIDCERQLAVTLGPWTYRQESAVASGTYLTIWRRGGGDEWAVVLDHGIDNDPVVPGAPAEQAVAVPVSGSWPPEPARKCAPAGNVSDLVATERRLNDLIRSRGHDEALRSMSGKYRISLRDGHMPAVAGADWPQDDPAFGASRDAVNRGAHASPGSDMGYTYGEMALGGKPGAPGGARAAYIRVWTLEQGQWRVAIDMLTALAAPSGSPAN